MSNAPSLIKEANFNSLYRSITAEAATRATEAENCKKLADLKRKEIDLKEQSIKLRESLLDASMDGVSTEETKNENGIENDIDRGESTGIEVCMQENKTKSKWLQLLEIGDRLGGSGASSL